MKKITRKYTEFDNSIYEPFEVKGAGNLIFSNDASTSCGGVVGFSIGAEWGEHGYIGGVISKEEAIRLAKHIMRTVNLDNLLDG